MNYIQRALKYVLALLIAVLPSCVTNPLTGETEFSPESASRHLKAAQIVAEEISLEVADDFPDLALRIDQLSEAVGLVEAAVGMLGEGMEEDADIQAKIQTVLDITELIVDGLDEGDVKDKVEAVIASIRIAVRVAGVYAEGSGA